MKKSKFSPQQIARILKEFDNGNSSEISREYGISTVAFYVVHPFYDKKA